MEILYPVAILFCINCFLLYRPVVCLHIQSAVFLACPAQVGHWLHDNNLWGQLPPQGSIKQTVWEPSCCVPADWYSSHTTLSVADDGRSWMSSHL